MKIREFFTYKNDEPVKFMVDFWSYKDSDKFSENRRKLKNGEDVIQYKNLVIVFEVFGNRLQVELELSKTGVVFFSKDYKKREYGSGRIAKIMEKMDLLEEECS